MSARIGMSMRTALACLAAVVLLPLLVFVDLPAADAHPKTKTVRTCIVDPPINHCTTKTVNVVALLTRRPRRPRRPPTRQPKRICGALTTTTAPPPPKCPTGTTGVYPNMLAVARCPQPKPTSDHGTPHDSAADHDHDAICHHHAHGAEHRHGNGACHSHQTTTTTTTPPTTTTTSTTITTTTTSPADHHHAVEST